MDSSLSVSLRCVLWVCFGVGPPACSNRKIGQADTLGNRRDCRGRERGAFVRTARALGWREGSELIDTTKPDNPSSVLRTHMVALVPASCLLHVCTMVCMHTQTHRQ